MDQDILSEIWEAVRPHIAGDYKGAAKDFVAVLHEHGVSLEDFLDYTSDTHIKKAALEYVEVDLEEDEEIEFEFDDDEMYNDMEY
jgi:hypothetical protein